MQKCHRLAAFINITEEMPIATAIAALRMGSKVGFVTRVGNDAFK